jgi:hypothetical protein
MADNLQTVLAAIADYSFADIAKAAKAAMVQAALGGQSVLQLGKTVQRITPEQAMKLYEFASQASADEASDTGGGNGLVEYGERV